MMMHHQPLFAHGGSHDRSTPVLEVPADLQELPRSPLEDPVILAPVALPESEIPANRYSELLLTLIILGPGALYLLRNLIHRFIL